MNDIGASGFYSAFWDYYVAIITIVSVLGCAVFLWSQSRRTVKAKVNAKGEIETTGHVWDGDLQEYPQPDAALVDLAVLLTVLFSVVYLILYPGLGTQWQGVLKWTQIGSVPGRGQDGGCPLRPDLRRVRCAADRTGGGGCAARQMGERIFLNNCAAVPRLGRTRLARLSESSRRGLALWWRHRRRSGLTITDGRNGVMPPMGAAVGGKADVDDVANYVLSLFGFGA